MNKFFMVILVISASMAWGKTDVRALVSRPKEVSTKKERKCRAEADCIPIQCHSRCGFDGIANKKSATKIGERCANERHESGEDRVTVDCAMPRMIQEVKCKRGYCALEESMDPRFGPPKIGTSKEEPAEED